MRVHDDPAKQTDLANIKKFEEARHRLFRTLYHEAFHAYLAGYVYPPGDADVPRWLNEGLAQIFETAIVEAGELRVGHADAERLARVQAAVRKGEQVALADLLKSGAKQFVVAHGSDREVADRYYLASWALAFHLMFEREAAEILGLPHGEIMQAALIPVAYTIGTDFQRADRSASQARIKWNRW